MTARANGLARALLVLLVALASSTVGVRAAYACKCVPKPALDKAVPAAEVAFVGRVTRVLDGGRYAVRVDRVLKGTAPATVTVRGDEPGTSSCGIELSPGPIVYADRRDLRIIACSTVWHGAAATRALAASSFAEVPTPAPSPAATTPAPEPTAAPAPARDGGTPLGWVAGGLLAAGGAAALLLGRRRNPATRGPLGC